MTTKAPNRPEIQPESQPALRPGTVYLVGAGPGDPELLTVKAVRLLGRAGVVLHDDLVPASILELAGRRALVVSVGKRCGPKKITQASIHEQMIAAARRGLLVVRLKSGDPAIFGRAGEEIDALRAARIPFEIVPGVTAASSAAALLGASLTRRRLASKLIVLSAHHAAGETVEHAFGSFRFPEDATLAIYMPGPELAQAAAALIANGLPARTPCVVVSDASRPSAGYRASRLDAVRNLDAVGNLEPGSRHAFLPGGEDLSAGPRLLLVGRVFESTFAGFSLGAEAPDRASARVVERVRERAAAMAARRNARNGEPANGPPLAL